MLNLNEPSASPDGESQIRLLPLFIAFSIVTMTGAVLYTVLSDTREVSASEEIAHTPPAPVSALIPQTPKGESVKSIAVRGRTIRVGNTADHVFEILKPEDTRTNEVWPDPAVTGSQVVRKSYEISGKTFFLTFRRSGGDDLLPYRLATILIAAKSSATERPNIVTDAPSTTSRESVAPAKKLDCYDLSQYGKARGDSFFVVVEAVRNAERDGLCTWVEQD